VAVVYPARQKYEVIADIELITIVPVSSLKATGIALLVEQVCDLIKTIRQAIGMIL